MPTCTTGCAGVTLQGASGSSTGRGRSGAPRGPEAVLPETILEAHGRLLRFSPACSERYSEHAPLLYRLPVRQLDGWYDLEALLGGLNTVLARRGSPLRATALAPHCIPCAQVVVGPIDGLIEAAFDGLIEVTDPFRELWTHRQFDPGRLVEGGE